MKLSVELDGGLQARIKKLFPAMTIAEVVDKSVRKAVADAELQAFAAIKRAEVEAEARRLNEELSGKAAL